MPGKKQASEAGPFKLQEANKQITIRHEADEFRSYANHVGVLVGPEEAILFFALRNPEHPEAAEGIASIYVTIPHLKRLASTLTRTIEEYEQVFGPVVADVADRLLPEARAKLGL